MNTCPKCGSEGVHEAPAFSLTSRIWFGCGSYSYAEAPEKLASQSNQCRDQEEINDLRRKVEELQVALDFANEAIDQRERSRTEAETKRDQWRECAERLARCIRAENNLRPLLFSADFETAFAEFDRLMEDGK